MSPTRIAAVALLVAVAGCAGLSGDPGTTAPTSEPTTGLTTDPTTAPTTERTTDATTRRGTEPHTAAGTSHAGDHLLVDTSHDVDNVTVTLGTGEAAETYATNGSIDLTREIHDRGHDVRVVVERGDETVFNGTARGYQYWEVHVAANDTRVSQVEV